MKIVCYEVFSHFITKSELDFIEKLQNKFNVIVVPHVKNRLLNLVYLVIIKSALYFEKTANDIFKISRNYQNESLVKLNIKSNYDSSQVDYYMTLASIGIKIEKNIDKDITRIRPLSLLDQIGRYTSNGDQVVLQILSINKEKNDVVFEGHYEIDKLKLNNQIIIIKRLLSHGLLYSNNL